MIIESEGKYSGKWEDNLMDDAQGEWEDAQGNTL